MDILHKFVDSKFIFVIGIGGSDLASKAVWTALNEHKQTGKKIFFLEAPDSREYEEVQNFVNNEITTPAETALIAVSKSGKTEETLETFHKTFDILSEKFGTPITDRVLVISEENSPLWNLALTKNFEKIAWPHEVGGRFSAFAAPHLSILTIAGADAENFFKGSESMTESGKDDASKLAKQIFDSYQTGADILDLFLFNEELENLGKWCRQLIAESLGKENEEGERVGLTPTVSIGPTDLHSMLQLDLGGPRNKFTIFIKSKKEIAGTINEEAYRNTTEAYEKESLPHFKYEMPEISEFELGKFMQFMIMLTLELAKLLEVNPYDQPEVEKYKRNITDSK